MGAYNAVEEKEVQTDIHVKEESSVGGTDDDDTTDNRHEVDLSCRFGYDITFAIEQELNAHYMTDRCSRRVELKLSLGEAKCECCDMMLAGGALSHKHMMGRQIEDSYSQCQWLCRACGIEFPSKTCLYHHLVRIKDPVHPISAAPPSSLFETEYGFPNPIPVLWRTSTGGGLAERGEEYEKKNPKIATNLLAKCGLEHLPAEVFGGWVQSKIVSTILSFDVEVAYLVEEDVTCSPSHNQIYKNAEAFTNKIREGLNRQDGLRFLLVIGVAFGVRLYPPAARRLSVACRL